MLPSALAIATLAAAPAPAQDARTAALNDVATILHSTVEGFDTPLGWVPDLLTYGVNNTGCVTNITRYQRRVTRGSKIMPGSSDTKRINWSDVTEVKWMLISNTGRNPNGVRINSRNGATFLVGLMSDAQRTRFMSAAETLKRVCSAPAPAPAPRTMPSPGNAPTPASAPAARSSWLIRYNASECYPRELPGMMIGPQATTYTAFSRVRDNADYIKIIRRTDGTVDAWIFAGTYKRSEQVRGAKLSFDGRPSGISLVFNQSTFRESGRFKLPIDILDRLGGVSKMGLVMTGAGGITQMTYTFNVVGASHFNELGRRANWSCAQAQ